MKFGRKKPTLRDPGGQILATKSVLLPWFFGYFSGPFEEGTMAIVLRGKGLRNASKTPIMASS